MDVYLCYERWKHPLLWRENVDFMTSQCPQTYLWIPCECYSSLANQIMCNKQIALELHFTVSTSVHTFTNVICSQQWQNKSFLLNVFGLKMLWFKSSNREIGKLISPPPPPPPPQNLKMLNYHKFSGTCLLSSENNKRYYSYHFLVISTW